MKYISIVVLFGLLPLFVQAQNFSYKAKLNPANNASFYKININADIAGHSSSQLQDLRLFDNDGNEVPYLLNKEKTDEQITNFETYPFSVSKQGNKGIIVIENKNKTSLHQFLFEMKNAEASRLVRISGSDNEENWFVVRDSFSFESYSNSNTPLIQKVLEFPETDYKFYKIEINNGSNESPLNIVRIGNNNTSPVTALFQPVNGMKYNITNESKSTFIHFKLKPGNRIDQLVFTIDAPEMFRRSVIVKKFIIEYNLYSDGASSISKVRSYVSASTMNAELSSQGATTINSTHFMGDEKCDSFTIEILNQDDAPLHIKEIKAFQLKTTITAKLEKDKSYFLYFGDSLMSAPTYDLIYFQKNIPANVATIDAQQIQPKEQKDKDEYNGNNDKLIVWIGLGLAGITILLLTINMMKKMKQEG